MDIDNVLEGAGNVELDPNFLGSTYVEAALTTFQVRNGVYLCLRFSHASS